MSVHHEINISAHEKLSKGSAMTVSIIVPIFNTERYLKRCVDSLANQDYADLEIILVDDGSTDASGRICDEGAKSDSRIKVIHQANGGEAAARNAGIAAATGEYMLFSDSDDEYLPNAVALLTDTMKDGADLTMGAFLEVSGGITRYASTGESPHTRSGLIRKMINDRAAYGTNYMLSCLQAKLFKTSVIREHDLRANTAFVVGNDSIFMMDYLACCNWIIDTFHPMYIYHKYDVGERVQGMSYYYPDGYRLHIEVWKRRVKIMDADGCWETGTRENILCEIADTLLRNLVRAATFEEHFPEGFARELEWAANDEFVRECLFFYRPKRETDNVSIPEHLKKRDAESACCEIRKKSEEWANREAFVNDRLYVRRMCKPDRISP
jgi:glycosyltransferase involved in cell wall biosynthesis